MAISSYPMINTQYWFAWTLVKADFDSRRLVTKQSWWWEITNKGNSEDRVNRWSHHVWTLLCLQFSPEGSRRLRTEHSTGSHLTLQACMKHTDPELANLTPALKISGVQFPDVCDQRRHTYFFTLFFLVSTLSLWGPKLIFSKGWS